MKRIVLVTGIGGNVGQGIVRNIQSLKRSIKIIGTNTEFISAGNHLCDKVYLVPFSTKKQYIPQIKKICKAEKVDLIIPSTDYEVYILGKAQSRLPQIAASAPDVTALFLNKYKTWQKFKELEIPFAETKLPSEYKNDFVESIVKPAEGRGSREIYINPQKLNKFSDSYIVQKLYKGAEITTAFYVTKEKKYVGQITFLRSMYAGTTSECEVTFKYNKQIDTIISKILAHINIQGSCNIQSIVTKKGEIVPFEINCRISGTNSVRSQFGFKDVEYTIDEYLYNKKPRNLKIKAGSAVRIYLDVIYPDIPLKKIKDKSTKHYIY